MLCDKHWFKELDDPQAAASPSQAFADTPIGQSLLKLDESQRKRLESLLKTAYGVVKAGKPFSDYELICEIQVKNGLDLAENSRNINHTLHPAIWTTDAIGNSDHIYVARNDR